MDTQRVHTEQAEQKSRLLYATCFNLNFICLYDLALFNLQCRIMAPCTAMHLDLWGAAKSAVHRDRLRTLSQLNTARFAFIRNISQSDLQKMFSNKIKRVQACIDARGHRFQHLL
jgi:hypothetical protein